MPTKLKLHRDEPDLEPASIPETYKFPVQRSRAANASSAKASRATSRTYPRAGRPLVAARVAASPLDGSVQSSPGAWRTPTPCAVVTDDDNAACAGRIMNSRDLVREIESTLDRMQSRLDSFRRQVEAGSSARGGQFSDAGSEDDDNRPTRPRAA